jgi:hypothetical protein
MRAASTATALAMARRAGWLAAVPRTALAPHGVSEAGTANPRLAVACHLWLVTRSARADVLVDKAAQVGAALGLSNPDS